MAVKQIEVNEAFIASMELLRAPNTDVGLIEACSQNVVVFAEKMLGVRLYAWQVYFLNKMQKALEANSEDKEFLALTSRQIGKSTGVAIFSVWCCVFNKAPGTLNNRTLVGITSASEDQAMKLLREMNTFMLRGDLYMANTYKDKDGNPMFGEKFFSKLLSSDDPNNTTTISFKPWKEQIHGKHLLANSLAGSVIRSYPPTAKVLGETFTVVVIDEAGMTDRISDQFFYDYIYPTGNSTNALRIYISTPWTTSGFFYRMVDPDGIFGQTPASVTVFTVDAIAIENPHYRKTVQKTIDQMNLDGKIDEVQRGYYCRFVKGEQSFFDSKKVFDCMDKEASQKLEFPTPCDMGLDFGGERVSKTVLTISYLDSNGVVQRIYHKSYEPGPVLTLQEDIAQLKTKFNIQRIIADDCPEGHHHIALMKDKGWIVQPMNFRSEKIKKFGAFRSMLNKNKIRTYYDEALQKEMLALEFKNNPRNSVIEHAPGYTDDLIDSFIMSAYFFLADDTGVKAFEWKDEEEE